MTQTQITATHPTFLRRWTAWVTLGEFLGFCLPAVTAALLWDRSPWLMVPGVLAAGAGEGAVLGWSQTRVLRHEIGDAVTAERFELGAREAHGATARRATWPARRARRRGRGPPAPGRPAGGRGGRAGGT